MVVPAVWRLEVVNTILIRERRRKLTVEEGAELIDALSDMSMDVVAEPLGRSLTELAVFARPHQLLSYDAAYLEVAVRQHLPLVTMDRNLQLAAQRLHVEQLWPPS